MELERSYFASDLGWKPGEWPEEKLFEDGQTIFKTGRKVINEGELTSVFYATVDGKWIEIFND